MKQWQKLRRLERRVAALEKLHEPCKVRIEISPKAVDLGFIHQILGSQRNPPKTDDTPRDTQ
jgi:hypothetical protein